MTLEELDNLAKKHLGVERYNVPGMAVAWKMGFKTALDLQEQPENPEPDITER